MTALELLSAAARFAFHVAALGGAGALFHAVLVPAGRSGPVAPRIGAAGAVAALPLLALQLWLQVAFLAGGWADSLDGALWRLVLDAPAGTAAQVQALALAGLLLAAAVPRVRAVAACAGGIGLALGYALVGHVTQLSPAWAGQALLTVHLVLAAFWLGSFLPLLAVLRGPRAAALAALQRFGALAVWSVPALILIGAGLALWLMGGVAPLATSAYGRVLLVKLALVAGLLLLAALNRRRLVPALAEGRSRAVPALRRSIVAELLLGLGVLAASAGLSTVVGPAG
jgi:putative copper resistance protein D